MGVSRITCMMLQGNEVVYLETPERWECWICHELGVPHALMLSCPKDDLDKMKRFVEEVKSMEGVM